MKRETVNITVLLLLVVVISFVFVKMIKGFLMALLVAAILAGLLAQPYRWCTRILRGRRPLAAVVVVILLILVALVPLAGLGTLVTAQALSIGEKVGQNGKTSGVIPFIRVMDSLTLAISCRGSEK